MKIIKTANFTNKEKEDFFKKRTKKHIKRVQNAARKLVKKYPEYKDLLDQVKDHDKSKFEEPERTPYIELTWLKKIDQDEYIEFRSYPQFWDYGTYTTLMNNIDCLNSEMAIPNSLSDSNTFYGHFNGNNYSITNSLLTVGLPNVNTSRLGGFGGILSGHITNLNFQNIVTSTENFRSTINQIGGFVGFVYGYYQKVNTYGIDSICENCNFIIDYNDFTCGYVTLTGGVFGEIERYSDVKNINVDVSMDIDTNNSNSKVIGIFAGELNMAFLKEYDNIQVTGELFLTASSDIEKIGGFIGSQTGNNTTTAITNSSADVNITINSNGRVSSISLFAGASGHARKRCYANGSLTINASSNVFYIGLFNGNHSWSYDVANCYVTGTIDITSGGTIHTIGGFEGYNVFSTDRTNCYCASNIILDGTITTEKIGAFTGFVKPGNTPNFFNCFYDSDLNYDPSSYDPSTDEPLELYPDLYATGKTTEEMQTESTFTDAGWDFVGESINGTDDIWIMETGGYPILTFEAEIS
jgi:hypothetical protein